MVAEHIFPFIHPDHFQAVWVKVATAVKGHLISTLIQPPQERENKEDQRDLGVWYVRDISDVAALLKAVKYKTITLAFHGADPRNQQIDFLVKK